MKNLKTFETYFTNPNEGPKYDGSMEDVEFEMYSSGTKFFKNVFNNIHDAMKSTTGNGLDLSNGVLDSFTGNQYFNIKSLVEDSTIFEDNIESLFFEDANIYTSDSGKKFTFNVILENANELHAPEFSENEGWIRENAELECQFGLLFEDDNEGDAQKIHLPKELKTFSISKGDLSSSLKTAFDWVKSNY